MEEIQEQCEAPFPRLQGGKGYVGTKILLAKPMDSYTFQIEIRKKEIEKGFESEDGYIVQYADNGYISWSPRYVFERCYRELSHEECFLIG